jgi:glycosyltransferase involved in cell wall biosynthesis
MIPRIAFVVQRCGLEVNGGAELHCRLVAERLSTHFATEVLTTCALDYMTWENHYSPGVERVGELGIRRFPVARPRDVDSFNRLSASLRPRVRSAGIAEQEEWMRQQGPWSPDLFAYIRDHRADYDAFVFFTYLYATTYFGLPLVSDRAILAPLAHDEWPIYFGMWDRIFRSPRAFIFNSEEELAFLRRRFSGVQLKGPVVGVAIEPPSALDPGAFRRTFSVAAPFVLYVGRVDESKGVGEMLRDFAAYRESSGDEQTELVLMGQRVMRIAERAGVRTVGFVSDADKWSALAACEALVMPSRYESLSIALLEAWSVCKPVLVTAASEVLVGQCRRSQGGLWYSNTDEFSAALDLLLHDERIRNGLGAQGQRFVAASYRWSRIVDAYREVISGVTRTPGTG